MGILPHHSRCYRCVNWQSELKKEAKRKGKKGLSSICKRQNHKEIKRVKSGQSWEQCPACSQLSEMVSLSKYLRVYFSLLLGSGHQQELLGKYCLCGMYFACICTAMHLAPKAHSILHRKRDLLTPGVFCQSNRSHLLFLWLTAFVPLFSHSHNRQ